MTLHEDRTTDSEKFLYMYTLTTSIQSSMSSLILTEMLLSLLKCSRLYSCIDQSTLARWWRAINAECERRRERIIWCRGRPWHHPLVTSSSPELMAILNDWWLQCWVAGESKYWHNDVELEVHREETTVTREINKRKKRRL